MWGLAATIFLSLNLLTMPVNYLPAITLVDDSQIVLQQQEFVNQNLPVKKNNDSWGVKISASSAAVIDKDTSAILWQKNAKEIRSIASITKLMTTLVFLENNPGWQTVVTMEIKDEVNSDVPEILRGEQIRVEDLFHTALIASDNNAAKALVRSTGLTEAEFIELMNQKAKALNLKNTKFVDVTGLQEGNQSTALEVLQLAKTAFNNNDIQATTKLAEYNFRAVSGKQHRIFSTNQLLKSYLNITAGKTGYINAAGYCLVSEVTNQQGKKFITVVLGSQSHDHRFQDLKILSTWILDNFSWS